MVKLLGLQFIQLTLNQGVRTHPFPAKQIFTRVSKRVKPGSIIVFHANGKGKQTRQVIEHLTREALLPRNFPRPMTVNDRSDCTSQTP